MPRVPSRSLQEFLLKFQGCHTTCPSSIQWLRGEIICATTETLIISYVACYSETNGAGDQGVHLDARPPEILVSEPNLGPALTASWSSRRRCFNLSSLSHGGSASRWDQGHCPTPPMKFHLIVQPHHPYVSHSAKQLTCSCNHWHIIRVYIYIYIYIYISSSKLNL